MRVFLLIVLLALTPAPSPPQTDNGIIEGNVVRSGTSEGINGARVTLTGQPNSPAELAASLQTLTNSGRPAQTQITATTDANGHFVLKDVPIGRYAIRAERDGYLDPSNILLDLQSRINPLNVTISSPQQHIQGIAVPLIAGATLSGRVLGPDGQPATSISVTALQMTYRDGRRTFLSAKTGQTNDRGEYRLFWLAPGEYYIRTDVRPPIGIPLVGREGWTRTYLPGTGDSAKAVAVAVAQGVEAKAGDLSIQSAPTFTISGTVAISPNAGFTLPNGQRLVSSIFLAPRDSKGPDEDMLPFFNSVASRQNGDFELRGVQPGSYNLYAQIQANIVSVVGASTPGNSYVGRTPVEVRSADVTGVTVSIDANPDVKGRITISGDGPPVRLESIRVQLQPRENIPTLIRLALLAPALGPTVNPDGAFTLARIPEARYGVVIPVPPPNTYLADVRYGGKSVYADGAITVSKLPELLEVVLARGGGTVRGVVQDSDKKAAPNMTVALVPEAPRRENIALYKTTRTDAAGQFTLSGLAPGDYKIFAWDKAPPNTAWLNADFLAPYESRGRIITVTSGLVNTQVGVIAAGSAKVQ